MCGVIKDKIIIFIVLYASSINHDLFIKAKKHKKCVFSLQDHITEVFAHISLFKLYAFINIEY